MKKTFMFLILAVAILLFCSSCNELFLSKVRFQNNSATKTVMPIWDGINMATLAPGQITEYSQENPGSHTIKWKNAANNQDLTSLGYPNLVAGESSTFPYND